MSLPDLIAITDPVLSDDELCQCAERVLVAVPPSSVGFQLRDRTRPAARLLALAERLKIVCQRYTAPLYLNDRVDIALASGAEGVHLGGGSVEVGDARRLLGVGAFVSRAAHTFDEVECAAGDGPTAALLSPIFATPGKGEPRGVAWLTEARRRARGLAIFALGGVGVDQTAACVRAGAYGVAAVRAVWHAEHPAAAARSMVMAIRATRGAT